MSCELECRFPGCGRPAITVKWGLCNTHGKQRRRGVELTPIAAKLPPGCGPVEALAKYAPAGLPGYSCWEWTGPRYRNGYGVAHVPGRPPGYAHRLAWEVDNGRQPDGSEHVRHKCDNRLCVNPRHLILGTRTENMAEMVERDRSVRGERNGMQRIPPGIIIEIRERAAQGVLQKTLAADYGISRGYVSEIVNRKRWSHI